VRYTGRLNQRWDVTYSEEMPAEPKKGQLNKDFGLYVERHFYIVSKIGTRRYLDLNGKKVVLRKYVKGRKTQQWYFDQKTLTIRSSSNNQSLDIANRGRSTNLQVWKTNNGWW
jgi:hypothetical protein